MARRVRQAWFGIRSQLSDTEATLASKVRYLRRHLCPLPVASVSYVSWAQQLPVSRCVAGNCATFTSCNVEAARATPLQCFTLLSDISLMCSLMPDRHTVCMGPT